MAVGPDGRWEAGIGDPSVIGWVTVAAYAAAALLSLRCARRASESLEFRFWVVLTAALLLLGINKQLDLQSLFTQTARDLAFAQGWYESRRLYQAAFIGFLIAGGLAVAGLLLWTARRLPLSTQIAAVGLVVLLVFVVIRGASFHHVDEMLGSHVEGIRFNWLLELVPLLAISAGAFSRRRGAAPASGRRRRRSGRRGSSPTG
jgi:hypothetical protein